MQINAGTSLQKYSLVISIRLCGLCALPVFKTSQVIFNCVSRTQSRGSEAIFITNVYDAYVKYKFVFNCSKNVSVLCLCGFTCNFIC